MAQKVERERFRRPKYPERSEDIIGTGMEKSGERYDLVMVL